MEFGVWGLGFYSNSQPFNRIKSLGYRVTPCPMPHAYIRVIRKNQCNQKNMNARVKFLRTQSLEAVNTLNHERAVLVTEFYRDLLAENEPVPVQRALCFRHILAHKCIFIGEQELIVGVRVL